MKNYNEYVLQALRLHQGLDKNDTSHDEQLQKVNPKQAFCTSCKVHFGCSDADAVMYKVLSGCGLRLVPVEQVKNLLKEKE